MSYQNYQSNGRAQGSVPASWGGRQAVPKLKQVVRISQASIAAHPSNPGTAILFGIPENHPAAYLNHKPIRSSKIVKFEGNRVETQNTIYDVKSWQVQEYEYGAN